ncbi:MAG: 1-deoxy-D-xylulose-5-phosphate reductoisomerase [Rhodothermales bacterium]
MSLLPDTSERLRRGLAILGSTGSIGRQTLEVVSRNPELLDVRVLTCGRNARLLIEQARTFRPRHVVVGDTEQVDSVRSALSGLDIQVHGGVSAIPVVLEIEDIDVVLAAMVGFSGLAPVLRAAELGMTIALANKEALVVAGELVRSVASENGATIVPVDSEHSAIFQCLQGESPDAVERLLLTASGGPFRDRPVATFDGITREEALAHPNWSMGRKITIDSATMMNKGLELIEAKWLFGLSAERIQIVVHPQSVVHSMVEFVDGAVKAQLSLPNMQLPIQFALSYPARLPGDIGRIDWTEVLRLDFEPPDRAKFPCIDLAYEAVRLGGTAPAILNAANEVAVSLFLEGRISFTTIPLLIEDAMTHVERGASDSLEGLREVDERTRRYVAELKRAPAN